MCPPLWGHLFPELPVTASAPCPGREFVSSFSPIGGCEDRAAHEEEATRSLPSLLPPKAGGHSGGVAGRGPGCLVPSDPNRLSRLYVQRAGRVPWSSALGLGLWLGLAPSAGTRSTHRPPPGKPGPCAWEIQSLKVGSEEWQGAASGGKEPVWPGVGRLSHLTTVLFQLLS